MNMKTIVCLLVAVCGVNASLSPEDDVANLVNWKNEVDEKLESVGLDLDSLRAGVNQWIQSQQTEGVTEAEIQRMAAQWVVDSCLNGFDVDDEALAAKLNQFRAEGGCDLVQQMHEAAEVIEEDAINTLDGLTTR